MSPQSNKTNQHELPRRIPVLLRHSWYALNQTFRRRIAHLRLTPDQFTVLRNLFDEPGLTQRELCLRMASDPNTVAALTARMEEEGWIERAECTRDRRANRLRLLPSGKRRFTAADQIARELQDEVSDTLLPEQKETLLDLLGMLARGCQAASRRTQSTSRAKLKQP